MNKLKRYKSFNALKSDQKTADAERPQDNCSEFEDFIKRLQTEYNKKKLKAGNGRQFNR